MSAQRLAGKVALVTGASSGIGEAAAIALAAEGASVAVSARRAERLNALAARIAQGGGASRAFAADITIESAAAQLIDQVRAAYGRLDILVNSAGVMGIGPLESEPPDEWRAMFNTNVLATLYTTQAAVKAMRATGGGHVVIVSSALVRAALPGSTAYAMTKSALNSLGEGLRKELIAHRIRVTNVAPGAVESEITNSVRDPALRQAVEERRARTPMLKSEDVANAIVYAVTQPAHVGINEIVMRPAGQEF